MHVNMRRIRPGKKKEKKKKEKEKKEKRKDVVNQCLEFVPLEHCRFSDARVSHKPSFFFFRILSILNIVTSLVHPGLFSCFRTAPNSDVDYRIFTMHRLSFCMYIIYYKIHTGDLGQSRRVLCTPYNHAYSLIRRTFTESAQNFDSGQAQILGDKGDQSIWRLRQSVWPSGKAGKQKDPGSNSLRLSFLFKSCGLWTLSYDFVPHNQ